MHHATKGEKIANHLISRMEEALSGGSSEVRASQILLALADELGSFTPLIGGPAYAQILLKPLEDLAAIEETVVREKAVQSLHIIGQELPANSINSHFVPLVKVGFLPSECLLGMES